MCKKNGFTLIEMIITIAIGAIVMFSISMATQTQIKTMVDNRNYLIALHLAKRQMAIMNNAAYPSAVAETALTADLAFPNFIVTQEVVELDSNSGNTLREIRVRVRRGSASGPVLIALYTYRSNILTFGNGI